MMPGPTASHQPCAIAFEKGAVYSDWDLYRFGLTVGLRTIRVAPRHGVKQLILPVEYIRCAETRYVLRHLDVRANHLVLDIGSPKLLSLFLARQTGALVYATDLLDYFFAAYGAYADGVLGPNRTRYRMDTQDARTLTYASDTFDRVFSISAVEHIPNDGDRAAMLEIARVLRPGGIACITLPWRDSGYIEEFKRQGDPDVYWATTSEDMVFYQRAYDLGSLKHRLLRDSGLETLDLSFWGERKIPVEHILLNRALPRLLRWAMLPAHFPLSRLFLSQLTADEPSRKKVACLTLRKPVR